MPPARGEPTQIRPCMRLDELAADVEAEARAADAAGHVRVEAVELLEDAPLLGGGDAEALVVDGKAHARRAGGELDLDAPAVGEYLIALSTRLTSTWRVFSGIAGDERKLRRREE